MRSLTGLSPRVLLVLGPVNTSKGNDGLVCHSSQVAITQSASTPSIVVTIISLSSWPNEQVTRQSDSLSYLEEQRQSRVAQLRAAISPRSRRVTHGRSGCFRVSAGRHHHMHSMSAAGTVASSAIPDTLVRPRRSCTHAEGRLANRGPLVLRLIGAFARRGEDSRADSGRGAPDLQPDAWPSHSRGSGAARGRVHACPYRARFCLARRLQRCPGFAQNVHSAEVSGSDRHAKLRKSSQIERR